MGLRAGRRSSYAEDRVGFEMKVFWRRRHQLRKDILEWRSKLEQSRLEDERGAAILRNEIEGKQAVEWRLCGSISRQSRLLLWEREMLPIDPAMGGCGKGCLGIVKRMRWLWRPSP